MMLTSTENVDRKGPNSRLNLLPDASDPLVKHNLCTILRIVEGHRYIDMIGGDFDRVKAGQTGMTCER